MSQEVVYSPSSPEALKLLRLFADEEFQRLDKATNLLELSELYDLFQESQRSTPSQVAALTDLYEFLSTTPLMFVNDPRPILDAVAWFESIELLLDEFIGPRPDLSDAATDKFTLKSGITASAAPIYELAMRLLYHHELISAIGPENLDKTMQQLRINSQRLKVLLADLQRAETLAGSLQAYRQLVRGTGGRLHPTSA